MINIPRSAHDELWGSKNGADGARHRSIRRSVEKTSWNDKDTGEIVEAFSVKINQAPIGWDEDCVAVPYRERPD